MVKVSFSPYLVVVDLLKEIIPEAVRLILDRDAGALSLFLPKATAGEWEQLSFAAGDDEIARRRDAAVAREQERQRVARQSRANLAYEQERAAMKSQMALEDRQRAVLQQRQQEEKETAQAEAVRVLQEISKTEKPARASAPVLPSDTSVPASSAAQSSAASSTPTPSPSPAGARGRRSILQAEEADVEAAPRAVIAPRASTAVRVQFTPRAFPTPLRESKVREEEDWLARNYLRLKQGGNRGDPTRPFVERDPAWLKDKGDAFARAGDWPSADAAYSAALDSDPSSVDIVLNRSLARLCMDKKQACVEDCMAVVGKLLDGAGVAGSRVSKAAALAPRARGQLLKALGRSVLACVRTGAFQEAYQAALSLRQFDTEGDIMAEGVEAALEELARAESHKSSGDSCVRAGEAGVAMQHYDGALKLQPEYAQALLNKAAALHGAGQWEECENMCTRAISSLSSAPAWSSVSLDVECIRPVPYAGTALHQQCKVRAEVRIADCRAKLGKGLVEAVPAAPTAPGSVTQ